LLDSIQPGAGVVAHGATEASRMSHKRCRAIPAGTLSINLSTRHIAARAARCPSESCTAGAPNDLDRRELPDAPLDSDALKSSRPTNIPAQRKLKNQVHAALE
jgi:hypothetical protein